MSGSASPDALAARALEQVQARLPGAEASVTVDRHRMGLTRFAVSAIHQNVAEETTTLRLVVHHAGRTASTSGTLAAPGDSAAVVERVAGSVGVAPLDPGWPGVAPSAPATGTAPPDPGTAAAGPRERAEAVAAFVEGAAGLETAGYCRSTSRHWAVTTSAGQAVAGEAAECGFAGVARTPAGSGMADGVARLMPLRLADLDAHALGVRAGAKARSWAAGGEPLDLPPGRYEVVLEPDAVSDLLHNLGAWGFAGRMVSEQRSFVRLGDDQLDPALTLVDDPLAVGQGFDEEGTPTRRLVLVDAGRCVAVSHDRRTAAEAGTQSTGHHGLTWLGAVATARHLGLEPSVPGARAEEVDGPAADSSSAALVGEVERGLLVSDLWYTRVLDSRRLVLTGLTRNGVWLIEDGQVTRPVGTLRFTQSYADALAPGRVLGVGRTATPIPGDTYSATSPRLSCPALRLASWNVTGGAAG